VKRLEALAERYSLPAGAADALGRLLMALAAEPDPHTTVSDPVQAADVHVADSLAGLEVPALRAASSIVDIGAGAGFPGLVLALALPEARVDLIEATHRKVEVIERLAAAAGLKHGGTPTVAAQAGGDPAGAVPARALPAPAQPAPAPPDGAARLRALSVRAEEWAAGNGAGAYEVVTARALAPLAVLVEYAAPLLRSGGVLVAWKGSRDPAEEDAGAAAASLVGLEFTEVLPVTPYRGSRDRHLYVYMKVRDTPDRFPRRPGMAAKRPLSAK
jgi:16S rRNA (guanine527-N7)-methyltransferase